MFRFPCAPAFPALSSCAKANPATAAFEPLPVAGRLIGMRRVALGCGGKELACSAPVSLT